MADTILAILTDLTGQEPSFKLLAKRLAQRPALGYSQFNELLLLLSYDRVSHSFFQYLVDGTTDYRSDSAFKSLTKMREGVDKFRVLAILRFGNVKYAFKYLSRPSTDLAQEVAFVEKADTAEFTQRHNPLVPVAPIPGDQTYLLGYLVKKQLEDRLAQNPGDESAKKQLADRRGILEKGRQNHLAYLASDHMDVYVATSMREPHEYQMVSQVVQEVFSSPNLRDLKLRWFDPTQACCEDRIDKGLAEGLMLKRAMCTLYLAQESDTLGKDSELASTLAQGKPVIAYIPRLTESRIPEYVESLIRMVARGSAGRREGELVLHQLRVFSPGAAWTDKEVMSWLVDPSRVDIASAKRKLGKAIREHYDKRADTLKHDHPLGLQVNLETGVANGVLVARSTEQCAELIRRILTRTMEFRICEKTIKGSRYLLLKEKMTDSVFRVVTGDRFLTNTFWNFYLPK
jgi:hypothetical protein